jgi:magnesium chelatase family protein
MDRVDVHLNLRPVNVAQLRDTHYPTQSTAAVRARVETARDAARERWSGHGYQKNALVPGALLRSSRWRLPPPVSRQLDHALEKNMLSMRGYDRTLRLAWSIADVEGAITPTSDHVGVAFLMRQGAIE